MSGEKHKHGKLEAVKLHIADDAGRTRAVIGGIDVDARPRDPDIHVSEAMVSAGLDCYRDCLQYADLLGDAEIKAIFCSMVRASRG